MKPKSESSILCQTHDIADEYQSMDQQQNGQQLSCKICVEKLKNEIDLQSIEESKKKQIYGIQQDMKKRINTLNSFLVQIDKFQIYSQESLDKLAACVQEKIQLLKLNFEKFQGFLKVNQSWSNNNIEIEGQALKKSFTDVQKGLLAQLDQVNFIKHLDNLIQHLECEWDPQQNDQKRHRLFYPILQKSFEEESRCESLSFNYNDSILAAGCVDKIKIYSFRDSKLFGNHCLQNFESYVSCLKFFPTSENIFASGHQDGRMKIWKLNQNYYYFIHQEICENKKQINCMDCTSNLLVTGDDRGQITFWRFYNSNLIHEQSIKFLCSVRSLSINAEEDKVLCSVDINNVIIFSFDGKQWSEIQKIVDFKFVNSVKLFENHFILQSIQPNSLVVYKLNKNKYEKDQEIILKGKGNDYLGFPICPSKNGFICRHSNNLNFFVYTKSGAAKLEYTIKCASESVFGCISNSQDYFIVWEQLFEELRVFKIQEQLEDE